MQRELSASCDPDSCGPGLRQHAIQILGVNRVGSESGNTTISTGRILPWLQDTAAVQVWYAWRADADEIFIREVVQLLHSMVFLPDDYIIRQGE